MRLRALCLLGLVSLVLSTFAFAATQDRITQAINGSQLVPLTGNTHGLAKPEFDVGRLDGSRPMNGIRLAFKLSAEQQTELQQLLTQLQNRNSPNFHKFLTVEQFADQFGLSENDIEKITEWLQSEGFANISVNRSHTEFTFDGTVALFEKTFGTEMHGYLVDGEVHVANSRDPNVPAALAGVAMAIWHINSFAPKPHIKVRPNFTSYVSGSHFLSPADFATIYDVNPLYTAGDTGTGQKIAIVGQSTVNPSDLSNFRSAAGLTANAPTLTLIEGTATRCGGDEGESDLDLEWSGGVAQDAAIIFLYAGLDLSANPPDTCTSRLDSVWDAMQDALTTSPVIAPFVSSSYGYYEAGNGESFALTVQQWAQEGQTLGITMVSASGDAGAADADADVASATHGLTVNMPASIPEVTGAGGNEFTGDTAGTVTGTPPNTTAGPDAPYWSGSGTGTDTISSALQYIPEEAWNDTTESLSEGAGFSASGGGASIYFSKPTWQTGTGVPNDGKRDVPDIAINASPFHDPYLICSEDGTLQGGNGTVSTCTTGFRTGTGGDLTVVGGTSAAAPTFTAIMALINQFVGNTPPTGLAPINPTLYSLWVSNPSSFNDIITGNNIVPCTQGTPNCPASAPFQIGFNAGAGYDQVTGLGSVNAYTLAQAWESTLAQFSVSSGTPTSVSAGNSTTATVTITPKTGSGFTGTVTLSCPNAPAGVTCTFNPATVTGGSGTTQVTIQTGLTTPVGTNSITVAGTSGTASTSTTVSLTVTQTTETFSLSTTTTSLQVAQGAGGTVTFTVSSNTGFTSNSGTAVPVSYTCSGMPNEATCVGPTAATTQTSVSFAIQTTAPSARLERPIDRNRQIFYALFLPGLLGIVFKLGSRKRSFGSMRVLGLILVLGFSTLWLGSCSGGNTSSNSNPGTPVGSYTITINASTANPPGISASPVTFTLQVTQ